MCVSPSMVASAKSFRTGEYAIASVVGFPSGKHLSAIKAEEARLAVAAGADEIDMVIDVGAALEGDFDAVKSDIAAVRDAISPDVILKVIVESAALLALGGEQTLVDVCRVAEDAGADFVKTSTGFHPSGGASVRAVELMARTVGDRLGVKASGGIRTRRRRRRDARRRRDPARAVRHPRGARRAGLETREAGVFVALRNRRVLRRELADHTAIGDLHGVGVDAERVVLGQLRR